MDDKQRNGESYAEYLLRRKAELTEEINKLDLYIYKLTCIIINDDVHKVKGLEDALPVFIDKKKKHEDELNDITLMLKQYNPDAEEFEDWKNHGHFLDDDLWCNELDSAGYDWSVFY